MTRATGFFVAAIASLAMMAAPAAGHHLQVDPPGNGTGPDGAWVGGPALPGKGAGLIQGGPDGTSMLAPAHAKGLVQACEILRGHGRAAADIFGPGAPGWDGCIHQPPPPQE